MTQTKIPQDHPSRVENNPFEEAAPSQRPSYTAGTVRHPAPYQRRSLFWPIVLIGAGILLLLADLGFITATGWAMLWRFWPIALIALGIDVLIGHRSVAGAIASGVLILLLVGFAIGFSVFAEQIPVLVELAKPAVLQQRTVQCPIAGLESADITIDWTSAPGRLRMLDDSPNLIEADVAYRGNLTFQCSAQNGKATVVLDSYLQGVPYSTLNFDDRSSAWDVRLHPAVELNLNLDTSSGSYDFDLGGLQVRKLFLDAGSGSVLLVLPAEQDISVGIDGGSGSIVLVLPESAGVRLTLERGSGSFNPGGRLRLVSGEVDDDGIWESADYNTAAHRIELTVDQGSGSLQIR